MKIPVMVALDEDTFKIWKKLPDQSKSATVRKLLTELKETKEKPQTPQELIKELSAHSDELKASPNSRRNSAASSYATAAITSKRRKSYSRRPEDNIKRQLKKGFQINNL